MSTQKVVHSNPETFHFMKWGFDITALRCLLQRTKTPLDQIEVPVALTAQLIESDPTITPTDQRVAPLIGVEIDWTYLDQLSSLALTDPVFVAPMGEIGHLVIDGWHRIALARRNGVTVVPGLRLTRRHVSRVLLPGSSPLPPVAR